MQFSATFLSLAISLGTTLVVEAAPIQIGGSNGNAGLISIDPSSNKPHLVTSHLNTSNNNKDKNLAAFGLNICHDKILGHLIDCKTGAMLPPKSKTTSSQAKPAHSNADSPPRSKPAVAPKSGHKSESKSKSTNSKKKHGEQFDPNTKHQWTKHAGGAPKKQSAHSTSHDSSGDHASSGGHSSCTTDHSFLETTALDNGKDKLVDINAIKTKESHIKVDALKHNDGKGLLSSISSVEDHDTTLLGRRNEGLQRGEDDVHASEDMSEEEGDDEEDRADQMANHKRDPFTLSYIYYPHTDGDLSGSKTWQRRSLAGNENLPEAEDEVDDEAEDWARRFIRSDSSTHKQPRSYPAEDFSMDEMNSKEDEAPREGSIERRRNDLVGKNPLLKVFKQTKAREAKAKAFREAKALREAENQTAHAPKHLQDEVAGSIERRRHRSSYKYLRPKAPSKAAANAFHEAEHDVLQARSYLKYEPSRDNPNVRRGPYSTYGHARLRAKQAEAEVLHGAEQGLAYTPRNLQDEAPHNGAIERRRFLSGLRLRAKLAKAKALREAEAREAEAKALHEAEHQVAHAPRHFDDDDEEEGETVYPTKMVSRQAPSDEDFEDEEDKEASSQDLSPHERRFSAKQLLGDRIPY